jgi:hypothetical protein
MTLASACFPGKDATWPRKRGPWHASYHLRSEQSEGGFGASGWLALSSHGGQRCICSFLGQQKFG